VLDSGNLFEGLFTLAQNLISQSAFQSRVLLHKSGEKTSSSLLRVYGIDSNVIDIPQLIAMQLYMLLYAEFSQPHHRQELVAALIGHISSNNLSEANAALEVLSIISECENNSSIDSHHQIFKTVAEILHIKAETSLFNFSPFLKSLLEDYQLRGYADYQLRIIFRLVFQNTIPKSVLSNKSSVASTSAIASASSNTQDSLPDDVMILIKKYFGSSEFKLRKISITAIVSCLGLLQLPVQPISDDGDDGGGDFGPAYELAHYLFNATMANVEADDLGR